MIAITIIVPIYNQAKYLKKCLDSLIIQEPKNIEFLLINDGSTDNSLSIMKEYAIKDHRFRIYSQENKGVAAARQKGLDIAKGQWISWVDPDDWIEPDTFNVILSKINNTNSDIVRFGGNIYDYNSEKFILKESIGINALLSKEAIERWGLYDSYIYMEAGLHLLCIRNDFIKRNNIRFSNSRIGEDYCFTFLCYIMSSSITYMQDKLYNYVRYDNSLIHKKTDENSNYINNIDCAYNYLLNNNLLEKKQLFWNEYLINAAGACFLYIPQKSHKYRNIINKLKRYFRSRNSWNEFKKRSALRTNTYIYEFYERLFSIRTVGLHGKAKHTIISILGIQIKIRKENNNGSITI